jgi:hypothetical protein
MAFGEIRKPSFFLNTAKPATTPAIFASMLEIAFMKNLLFAFAMIAFVNVALGQNGEFHLDKEFKIGKTQMIDLSCSDAKVFISGSRRGTVHVKIDRTVEAKGWTSGVEDFKVDVEETEEGLKIRERKHGTNVYVGYYSESYRIEIEAPEGAGLTVRGDDGDYFIKNINGSISLSLDDADAELTDCQGDSFNFRFDDGDLRMNTGRGKLVIDADDADVDISNAQFTEIDADVDDGDLVIETSLNDNGKYEMNDQDGLISLSITSGGGEFTIYHDDGHINARGNFQTTRESKDETSLILATGKAKVVMHADDANVKLSAQ